MPTFKKLDFLRERTERTGYAVLVGEHIQRHLRCGGYLPNSPRQAHRSCRQQCGSRVRWPAKAYVPAEARRDIEPSF